MIAFKISVPNTTNDRAPEQPKRNELQKMRNELWKTGHRITGNMVNCLHRLRVIFQEADNRQPCILIFVL